MNAISGTNLPVAEGSISSSEKEWSDSSSAEIQAGVYSGDLHTMIIHSYTNLENSVVGQVNIGGSVCESHPQVTAVWYTLVWAAARAAQAA